MGLNGLLHAGGEEAKLLSVVVPTYGAPAQLVDFLAYAKSHFADVTEILVSVSGTPSQAFLSCVKKWDGEAELVFLENPGANMIQNFNFALSRARGKYLCFLGDDDGVSYYVEKLVKMMEERQVESLTPKVVGFNWPGVDIENCGTFNVPRFSGSVETKDYFKSLDKMYLNGGFAPHEFPKIYYGIVSRRVVNEVVDRHGSLFGYPSPDAHAFLRLGEYLKEYEYIDIPIFIGGSSPSSNSGKVRKSAKRNEMKIECFDYLKELKFGNIRNGLPNYFSRDTAWPYMMTSLIDGLIPGASGQIRLEPALARLLIRAPGLKVEVLRICFSRIFSGDLNIKLFVSHLLFWMKRRIKETIRKALRIRPRSKETAVVSSRVSDCLSGLDRKLCEFFNTFQGDLV